jgi:hypothetical protein
MSRDDPKPTPTSRLEKPPWQFSLRELFIVTAIVALCLGIGYLFPTTVTIVVMCGVVQAAIALAADWLIRPTRRRTLAFVTVAVWTTLGAVCWLLLGGTLLLTGYLELDRDSNPDRIRGALITAIWLATAGACSWFLAFRNWRKMSARRTGNSHGRRPSR